MKLNVVFSFGLHLILAALLFASRPGSRRFEGYPTVIPVELVEIKPVAYKAPAMKKIEPRTVVEKPEPKKVEGITVEKKKPVKEEPKEEPVKTETAEKPEEGKSVVGEEVVSLDVEEFPCTYYLARLQSRIQNNWEPPVQQRMMMTKKAIVYFKIQRSGRITNIAVETGSGDYLFDQAAVRAVTLANPLPPLPYDFPENSLGVHFEFDQGN